LVFILCDIWDDVYVANDEWLSWRREKRSGARSSDGRWPDCLALYRKNYEYGTGTYYFPYIYLHLVSTRVDRLMRERIMHDCTKV
jgi:hypothetical protein